MALIEQFWVVAAEYPTGAGTEIIKGMPVKLDTDGTVIKATGAGSEVVIGVAGDTKSATTSGLPAIPSSNVFVNRVSDGNGGFDETKASAMMTVYQNGGKFATNMYETGDVANLIIGAPVYCSTNSLLTNTVNKGASSQIIGYVTKVPGAYPSGVHGIDVDGSLSLGNYLEYKLVV